jgi:hypothetical protein
LSFAGLAALAVLGRSIDEFRIELDVRGRPVTREIAVLAIGTLTLAIVVGQIADSAYASRYAAVALAQR